MPGLKKVMNMANSSLGNTEVKIKASRNIFCFKLNDHYGSLQNWDIPFYFVLF